MEKKAWLIEGKLDGGAIIYLQAFVNMEDETEYPCFVFSPQMADQFETKEEAEAAMDALLVMDYGFKAEEHLFLD